jgi:hypothetical protein
MSWWPNMVDSSTAAVSLAERQLQCHRVHACTLHFCRAGGMQKLIFWKDDSMSALHPTMST